MSLDKSIANGREHRKPYYKNCYNIDLTCRNHGGYTKKRSGRQCLWCLSNRMIQTMKEKEKCEIIFDFLEGF